MPHPIAPGTAASGDNRIAATAASLAGLSWLNFLTALMQTGFGTFLAVYLASTQWSRTDIGLALSTGTAAAMAAQVPAGMLVDWAPSKRLAAAAGVAGIMLAALLIAIMPRPGPVYLAQVLQGVAAAVLTPAIAALTLALSRQEKLGERFGRNVRFAAIGSAVAAAIMGLIGAWLSLRAIFWVAAACALPCLAFIYRIRAADLETAHHRATHAGAIHPRHRTKPPRPVIQVCRDRALLVFAACLALFQLGNAAMLPTAASGLAGTLSGLPELLPAGLWGLLPNLHLRTADLLVAAWIVVPQLLAAALSPRLGRLAQFRSRRLVLLLGLAMLPVRALLFAGDGEPVAIVAYQMLDGISAAVLGVMVPLVVADITHGGGRFNLAIGVVGLASGVGATLSTAVAGAVSDRIGDVGTFLGLGGAGLCACALLAIAMPETQPTRHGAGAAPA